MRIGELARRTGASVRSLRYYEEQELLLPERTTGGQRRYGPDSVDRVELIRLLLAAGLSSRKIVDLLPCIYTHTVTPVMLEHLLTERARIEDQVENLVLTRARLDAVIAQAHQRLQRAS